MANGLQRTAGRGMFNSILHYCTTVLLLLSLLVCMSASAQVTFSNVAVTPTSGTVNGGGTLSVTFSGTVKASVANDAVSELYLYDNGALIHHQSFPLNYNSQGQLVNTLRTINVTVALSAGSHSLRFLALADEGGEGYSPYLTVTAAPLVQTNGASFVSQSVPTTMVPGQTYSISVTMKNTGSKTWVPSGTQSHGLGSQNPANNWNWGLVRAYTPGSVAPGATATFNFTVTAPPTAGTYNFQWQMLQEQVEWFGSLTPNLSVTVDWPPPTASFSSPAQNAVFEASNGTATVSFSGTASAGTGSTISSVQLLEGGVAFASGSSTSISGSKALAVGAHTIELRVKNSHNKTTSVYRNVTVRPPAPVASFTTPANGAVISTGTATASVPITATAVPASGASISQIRLYVDGVQKASSASASLSNTQTLAAGTRTLGVEATDNYGSISARTNITVTVQAPTPTATIATPANYSYFSAVGSTASIPVQGSATAVGGLAITKLELLDNSTVIDTKTNVTAYNVTRSFAPGPHSLQLRATNSANVQGSSGLVNFVVYSQVSGNSAMSTGPINVPATMRAGQPYTVSLTMLNNGTTTWTDAAGYRLGAQNPQDNRTWLGRAFLDSSVAPGQSATFTFQVTAPSAPGTTTSSTRWCRKA